MKNHTTHFEGCDCYIRISEHERLIKEKDEKIILLMDAAKTRERTLTTRNKEIAELKADRDKWKKCAEAHINFDRKQTIHDEENDD